MLIVYALDMFFEKGEIDSKLICLNCLKRFDEPKILPCGESICKSCLDNLILIDDLLIKCPLCKNEHQIPSNGDFPTQKILVEMLKLKPIKVYRGSLCEKLDAKLASIENRIEIFFNGLNLQEVKIKDYCERLRQRIEEDKCFAK